MHPQIELLIKVYLFINVYILGGKNSLCVRLDEVNPRLLWLTRLQNAFRSTDTFYPVYTYDTEFRCVVSLMRSGVLYQAS